MKFNPESAKKAQENLSSKKEVVSIHQDVYLNNAPMNSTAKATWLSYFADHKFKHNFKDCVNSICNCGQEIETSTHFLFHCLNYQCARQTLFEKVNKIDLTILK